MTRVEGVWCRLHDKFFQKHHESEVWRSDSGESLLRHMKDTEHKCRTEFRARCDFCKEFTKVDDLNHDREKCWCDKNKCKVLANL